MSVETKFLPYGRQSIEQADIEAVIAVLQSDFLTQGPAVTGFEKKLADYLGAKHCLAAANGTAGLHLAALALELGKGDAVFVPAITFAATSNALLYCGATPIFVDIDPTSNGMSLASLEKAYDLARKKGLNPRAIFVVHYAGLPCLTPELLAFAQHHRLTLVEDACHALGAEQTSSLQEKLHRVGGSDLAAMTVFSFHPVKHITTGEGGAVTTSDDELAKRLRLLVTHGITKDESAYVHKAAALDKTTGLVNPWYHEMQTLGFNYRLCDLQAMLGSVQLSRIVAFVDRRREIARVYDKELSGLPHLTTAPGDTATARHSYHLYPLRIDFESLGKSRRQVMVELRELGIGTQVHYIPVFQHPYYQNHKESWHAVDCPEAQLFYQQELSIPMYPALTNPDLERVVGAIKRIVQK